MASQTTKQNPVNKSTIPHPGHLAKPSEVPIDDLIRALSERSENRRAQVVWQWEMARRGLTALRKKAL